MKRMDCRDGDLILVRLHILMQSALITAKVTSLITQDILDKTFGDKACQWFAISWCFFLGKTDRYDITELLLCITPIIINKSEKDLKVQSRMDNPETLRTTFIKL